VGLGRAGREEGQQARVGEILFFFFFSKGEIVIVFLYFSRIFVELQKY
jgi:hypothetical protein